MRDHPERDEACARVRRRFERARIEALLFAKVCDILLSQPRRCVDDTSTDHYMTRSDRDHVSLHR